MDPVLIMDDILEKLHLLNYNSKFCPKFGRKPISRTYFAIFSQSEPTEAKVRYFVELSYWLMSLSFEELSGKTQQPIDNKYVNFKVITIDCRKDRSTSASKKPKRAPSASKPNPFTVDYDKFKSKEEAVDKLL